jgi:hypothetical protein
MLHGEPGRPVHQEIRRRRKPSRARTPVSQSSLDVDTVAWRVRYTRHAGSLVVGRIAELAL